MRHVIRGIAVGEEQYASIVAAGLGNQVYGRACGDRDVLAGTRIFRQVESDAGTRDVSLGADAEAGIVEDVKTRSELYGCRCGNLDVAAIDAGIKCQAVPAGHAYGRGRITGTDRRRRQSSQRVRSGFDIGQQR